MICSGSLVICQCGGQGAQGKQTTTRGLNTDVPDMDKNHRVHLARYQDSSEPRLEGKLLLLVNVQRRVHCCFVV